MPWKTMTTGIQGGGRWPNSLYHYNIATQYSALAERLALRKRCALCGELFLTLFVQGSPLSHKREPLVEGEIAMSTVMSLFVQALCYQNNPS